MAIPVGLLLLSIALLVSVRTNVPDIAKGIFFGFAIGVIATPLFVRPKGQ